MRLSDSFSRLLPWGGAGTMLTTWALPLLLAGAAFGAITLIDWLNDREAVADHEARVTAHVTEAQLHAEREANSKAETRRETQAERLRALRQAREQAIHEEAADVVAGPAVRAVMRELRTQAIEDRRTAG